MADYGLTENGCMKIAELYDDVGEVYFDMGISVRPVFAYLDKTKNMSYVKGLELAIRTGLEVPDDDYKDSIYLLYRTFKDDAYDALEINGKRREDGRCQLEGYTSWLYTGKYTRWVKCSTVAKFWRRLAPKLEGMRLRRLEELRIAEEKRAKEEEDEDYDTRW